MRFAGPTASGIAPTVIRFEESPVGREQLLQLDPFRPADRLPPAQQQPAFAATVGAYRGPRSKKLRPTHLVQRGRRVLQDVKLVEDNLRARHWKDQTVRFI